MKKDSKLVACMMLVAAAVSAGTAKADVIGPTTFNDAEITAQLNAGNGTNADGDQVAFVTRVPEPASLALLLAGLPFLRGRRS